MEGDLKVFPLTEVLELIHAHRRSGVLEVREGFCPSPCASPPGR
jgi:hypothetical protein